MPKRTAGYGSTWSWNSRAEMGSEVRTLSRWFVAEFVRIRFPAAPEVSEFSRIPLQIGRRALNVILMAFARRLQHWLAAVSPSENSRDDARKNRRDSGGKC